MLYDFYNPNSLAIQAFENLWVNNRPWMLIYHGSVGCGKTPLLSWLIANQCRGRIPYSLISLDMYSSDIDELFTSVADSIVSTAPNFRRDQVDFLVEVLTGPHWVGRGGTINDVQRVPMVFFFDNYQIFESRSTKDGFSHFLSRMERAHRRLFELRVVIASREYCHLPDTWFFMQEAAYFGL